MNSETYQKISLVPNLESLHSRIRQLPSSDIDQRNTFERYLEQLPYCLSSAAYALVQLWESQSNAVNRVCSKHRNQNAISTYGLDDSEWHSLSFALDRYLEGAHRSQNLIWVYLSKVLSISVPNSMSKLVKNLENSKLVLPEIISSSILTYWKKCGQNIKMYRDLSQHFAVVASDGRVTIMPDNQIFIYLVLPNNPSKKSPTALKYEKPRVDALPFVLDTYKILFRFICNLTQELLGFTNKPKTELYTIAFKGPMRMSKTPQGIPVSDIEDIICQLAEIRRDFE